MGRDLSVPAGDPAPLSDGDRSHLLDDARDLYWNELEWENLTGEEALDGGPVVQLAFPGFLAFVRGLLLAEAMPDSLAPASPRPQVVEDLLEFLAGQSLDLREKITAGGDPDDVARHHAALTMTGRLIDLVMFELYGFSTSEIEAADAGA